MIAEESDWIKATENLKKRRSKSKTDEIVITPVSDYRSHLLKCGYGESIIDVGCGKKYLETCLKYPTKYIGIDAFPDENTAGIIKMAVEDNDFLSLQADTICAFAVLDNCRDFFKACENMKKVAKKNIIILTGIGIEVDEYHTFKLELAHFHEAFYDWTCTHREEIAPKVFLLNYQK